MIQQCQTQATEQAATPFSGESNTSARVDEKNDVAAVLRRGHAEYIRRRGLQIDCTPTDEWLAALIRAAVLLEGGQ